MSVTVHGLCKEFARLKDVSFTLNKGELVALAGPDGSGKTTLLRLLAGLLQATSGTIKIEGLDPLHQIDALHQIVGYMPQHFGLYEDLTVIQNLQLYAELRKENNPNRFDELLTFTTLAPFKKRLTGELSGGMKQKLGLACAMMGTPRVLLLDEPSVGVDPISRRELWKMVRHLVDKQLLVLWSTTYLDEVLRCNRALVLKEGHLIYQGKASSLNEEQLLAMLGGHAESARSLHPIVMPTTEAQGPIIAAHQLTKQFDHFTAVHEVSFEIARGEIFGLLGPNGAGKSTIFKMLCGLLSPTSGQAMVNGISLQTAPARARAHIGYMAQKFSLYGDLSVKQNLSFFSGIYNVTGKRQAEKIVQMLELFDLQPFIAMSARLLPLGFKQRLSLACAIMHEPSVLFLDEPTSGVDPLIREEFWHHIRTLSDQGVTIIITTHYMQEAEFCDRVAMIYQSKIIELGTPAELKARTNTRSMEDAFIACVQSQP